MKNAKKTERTLLGKIKELENSIIKPQNYELKVKDEIIKRYKKEFHKIVPLCQDVTRRNLAQHQSLRLL